MYRCISCWKVVIPARGEAEHISNLYFLQWHPLQKDILNDPDGTCLTKDVSKYSGIASQYGFGANFRKWTLWDGYDVLSHETERFYDFVFALVSSWLLWLLQALNFYFPNDPVRKIMEETLHQRLHVSIWRSNSSWCFPWKINFTSADSLWNHDLYWSCRKQRIHID